MAEEINVQFSKMQQALHFKLMQMTDFSADRFRLLDPTVYAFVLLTQKLEGWTQLKCFTPFASVSVVMYW